MSDSSSDDDQQQFDDEVLSTDSEEEILASESEDDEEEEDEHLSRFKIEMKKDEMASDLEDDDDDAMPDVKAWGKDKKSYYHTDYIDKDYRSQKQRDQNLAEFEEEEALQIQKRLLESITDQDIGVDSLLKSMQSHSSDIGTKDDQSKSQSQQIGLIDASHKKAIIQQQSPEVELLSKDFEHYLHEIHQTLDPLVRHLEQSIIGDSLALKTLKLRLLLLTNYCANISLYLSMQCTSNRQTFKNHPIIKRLFTYKTLIQQSDNLIHKNDSFSKQIKFALESIRNQRPIRFVKQPITEISKQQIVDMKESSEDDEQQIDSLPDDDQTTESQKRAITYEMEKNKGLTPKRKREQRNPRVKYRRKYEKAVIRRKGQVREPRKEIQKYAGEMTGINVRSVKSVKFK